MPPPAPLWLLKQGSGCSLGHLPQWGFAGGGSASLGRAALICVSSWGSARLPYRSCILLPLAPTLSWAPELGSPGEAGQGVAGGVPRSCSLMEFEVIS